jgi:hypothetical protein
VSKTEGIRKEPVLSRLFIVDQLEPGGCGLESGAYLLVWGCKPCGRGWWGTVGSVRCAGPGRSW